jgi:hypothetical protein
MHFATQRHDQGHRHVKDPARIATTFSPEATTRIMGSEGADTFDFDSAAESAVGANRDIIKDSARPVPRTKRCLAGAWAICLFSNARPSPLNILQ